MWRSCGQMGQSCHDYSIQLHEILSEGLRGTGDSFRIESTLREQNTIPAREIVLQYHFLGLLFELGFSGNMD